MKALLLTASERLEITDVPRPQVSSQTVLVRVVGCGICGSDVHGYDGSSGRRLPPLIMGHEAAGIVEEVGSQVSRFQVGDRVTFDSTVSCGSCASCQRGAINLCDRREVLGVSCGDYRRQGAFADYVAVPERIVYALPQSIPLEHAALIEAVSVAVHAISHFKLPHPDQPCLVVGAGMIGLLILQSLRAAGCQRVIVVDQDTTRLRLAKQLGAEATVCADHLPATDQVLSLTQGQGVAAAWEAVGVTPTVQTAISSVAKGGKVILVGNITPTIQFPLQTVVTRELSVIGSCASAGEYPQCIEWMRDGRIDVTPLVSATAPLEEGPAWFRRLKLGEPGLMKVVLQP